ncbi:Crp/Fnr family transcriptional regulator [Niastella sp. OAS944]|uniref:Crp/Fnr family transcriptional regulator n=1 Tax=Niastella sp. OAS944 TaxID=2664089 RepID=UPI00348CDC95|nr:CRP-like cAMP-binding protein [Chitinophagaceae bacterium OAS944]
MEALFKLLNDIYPMSSGLQDYIFTHLKRRELKRKELLVKKNEINTIGSFLNAGLLHCYYLGDDDKKVTSWFLQKGQMAISVESFFSQTPSVECIEAMEPCEIFYLTYQEMQTAYKTYLEFNYIIRELIQKYYVIKAQHTYQLQKGTTTKERFEWFMNSFPEIITRVPRRHIASFLGVSEVTLSRMGSQNLNKR